MSTKIKLELSEREAELIQLIRKLIRNYKISYPNGHPQLLWTAQELFDQLTNPFEYDL